MRTTRFGLDGWLVEVSRVSPALDAREARTIARSLRRALPDAEVVSGGAAVLVRGAIEEDVLTGALRSRAAIDDEAPKLHTISVVYDGEDLEEVARTIGASVEEIVERHATTYTVEVMGFLPGFGYLAELDPKLVLPRRPTPRKRVPAGSVGIAGRYTGIYPFASPGGWHLLGRAVDAELFAPDRSPPTLFSVGDTVRFVAVKAGAPTMAVEKPVETSRNEVLLIEVCPPHATIQDLGRRLRGEGIPSSGALDRETHRFANRAVGNDEGAATLELPLDRFEGRWLRDTWFSVDGEPARLGREGEKLRIDRSERAVRYLALAGGIDVPHRLGSRSTLLVAGMGGLEGRRLRRGDRLGALGGDSPDDAASHVPPRLAEVEPIAIVRGPHSDRFPDEAFEQLLVTEWVVSPVGDRVGTRLTGAAIPRSGADGGVPEPMMPGAIQITTDGTPIVLGPDSAVTGGYPVLAVVLDTDRIARIRPGGRLRFVIP